MNVITKELNVNCPPEEEDDMEIDEIAFDDVDGRSFDAAKVREARRVEVKFYKSMSTFVEVPLGTTEDRLLGAIDPSRLLSDGKWTVQTGLIQHTLGTRPGELHLWPSADTIPS